MEHVTITADMALEALTAVVTEAGEYFIYRVPDGNEVCVYEYAGQPSCLVGRALARLGVPVEVLALLDGCTNVNVSSAAVHTTLDEHGFILTPDATIVLAAAQGSQDHGDPWGTALAEARRVARRP